MSEQSSGYQSGSLASTPASTPEPQRPIPIPPLSRGRIRAELLILFSGLVTSGLVLLAVFALKQYFRFNLLDLYGPWLLPLGLLWVGLCAASGYFLTAWLLGLRIRPLLVIVILILQVCSYFAAHYILFSISTPSHHTNGPFRAFVEYFDAETRSFVWETRSGKQPGEALKGWGYLIRTGEILFVCFIVLAADIALRQLAYCRYCERYLGERQLILLPPQSLAVHTLQRCVREGDLPTFLAIVREHRALFGVLAHSKRITVVTLTHCPLCCLGTLVYESFEDSSKPTASTKLGTDNLDPSFVTALMDAKLL